MLSCIITLDYWTAMCQLTYSVRVLLSSSIFHHFGCFRAKWKCGKFSSQIWRRMAPQKMKLSTGIAKWSLRISHRSIEENHFEPVFILVDNADTRSRSRIYSYLQTHTWTPMKRRASIQHAVHVLGCDVNKPVSPSTYSSTALTWT